MKKEQDDEQGYEVLVIGDEIFFAGNVKKNADGTITSDVYQNIEMFRAGIPSQQNAVFEYV